MIGQSIWKVLMSKSEEGIGQKTESSESQIATAIYSLCGAILLSTAMSNCASNGLNSSMGSGSRGENFNPYHVEIDGELDARLSTSSRSPLDIRLDRPIRIQLVDSEGKDIPVGELPEFFKQELDQAGP